MKEIQTASQGVRAPLPWERKPYVCQKCGQHFWSKDGDILGILRSVKCPDCGSRMCTRDWTIVF